MMSAYHMVDRAVEAMKAGAYDYLIKPFHLSDMIATCIAPVKCSPCACAMTWNRLVASTTSGKSSLKTKPRVAFWKSRKAAETDHTTILLQGESGTGKSVFANAIQHASPRASMPLLEIDCAALPDTLLESELFGFEPGAFTDARRRKEGLLERAHGGTLFLDEMATMSASVQAKLLRVLAKGTFMRLGGTRPIKVNVRLVAATNADLKDAVARGAVREDLYYRLNVVPLYIPPLRERKEDIVPLALYLLQNFNIELRKRFTGFTPAAAELLQQYPWPGNIREPNNVIERIMILAPEGDIDAIVLPEEIREPVRGIDIAAKAQNDVPSELDISPTGKKSPPPTRLRPAIAA